MKYKVIVYYDAINELHRLRGVKYRNSRMYTVEMVECDE